MLTKFHSNLSKTASNFLHQLLDTEKLRNQMFGDSDMPLSNFIWVRYITKNFYVNKTNYFPKQIVTRITTQCYVSLF